MPETPVQPHESGTSQIPEKYLEDLPKWAQQAANGRHQVDKPSRKSGNGIKVEGNARVTVIRNIVPGGSGLNRGDIWILGPFQIEGDFNDFEIGKDYIYFKSERLGINPMTGEMTYEDFEENNGPKYKVNTNPKPDLTK